MNALSPGFADPVRDSQAVFRAVMNAMARPGRIHRVTAPATPPVSLDRATSAVLLTLIDGETPLWMDKAASAAWHWVAFHCGASPGDPATAPFAVATGPVALDDFDVGSDEEPERSATLILQVTALGSGERLRLSGPGLDGGEWLEVTGLPAGFQLAWDANGRRFPRGVDVILCAGDDMAALPRTVMIG